MGRGFLRMKVEVKTYEALINGFWIPYKEEGRRWIRVKYEKLVDYFFVCGKIVGKMQKWRVLIQLS